MIPAIVGSVHGWTAGISGMRRRRRRRHVLAVRPRPVGRMVWVVRIRSMTIIGMHGTVRFCSRTVG